MKLKLLLAVTLISIVLFSCKKDSPAVQIVTKPTAVISFTIPTDSVILDPYGVAPLSALINFTSPVAGSTLIVVQGKNGPSSNIQHQFLDTGYKHSIPVVGLYGSYTNTVYLYIMSAQGDTLAKTSAAITTNPLPPDFPVPIFQQDVPIGASTNPGLNLVSNYDTYKPPTNNPFIPYMVDNFGDIRWVLNYQSHPPLDSLNYQCGLNRLRNGNLFFGDSYSNAIYEVDLLGKIINTWPLFQGYSFHHHVIEIPNGNFILTANLIPGSTHPNGALTSGDYVIEINRKTGSVDNIWDLKVSLDEYRTALVLQNPADWFHGNALLYDSTDNTIIVSGRVQCVAKLDFSNNVKWILSPHKGWCTNRRGEDLNKFLLQPLDGSGNPISDTNVINGYTNASDFEWNWYQHSPIFMPNGDMMLFDDGGPNRNFATDTTGYSRAVEYKIDGVKMTVQQIWEYGKERGLDTYSSIVSNVQYLPATNHVLFCPGYQVVNSTGQGGKIVEVDYTTRQVVSELSLSCPNGFGFHRTYRIDAYPANQ